jgi:hypothetical protein
MRRWQLLAALLLLAMGSIAFAGTRSRPPGRATVLGRTTWDDRDNSTSLQVIAGWTARHGWRDSEGTRGLMHKGDVLSLYQLGVGEIGTLRLTDRGVVGSEQEDIGEGETYGIEFSAAASVTRGVWAKQREGPLLAAWHSAGSPEPRWAPGRELEPKHATYRKVIADWLRAKGVSQATIDTVEVTQIVVADVNGDGKDEVFLSFATPQGTRIDATRATKRAFSYLLMRYVPKGKSTVKTVVLARDYTVDYSIAGFCDLNGDGWAEVASDETGVSDYTGTCLYHWTGRGFKRVNGWGWGC